MELVAGTHEGNLKYYKAVGRTRLERLVHQGTSWCLRATSITLWREFDARCSRLTRFFVDLMVMVIWICLCQVPSLRLVL